ncbi:acyloxyacyl hydrolase [Haliea sp.]
MRRQCRYAAQVSATLLLLASPITVAEARLNLSAGQVGIDRALDNRGRYGLEYRFSSEVRLGLALYHLSNASLGDENPGNEEIVISVNFPLR